MNEKLDAVYKHLIKTANRRQQNTDNVLLLVENCDIKLEILNKLTHLSQSERQINVMSELFFCEGFLLGHVIITMMIICDVIVHFNWPVSQIILGLLWKKSMSLYYGTALCADWKFKRELLGTKFKKLLWEACDSLRYDSTFCWSSPCNMNYSVA